MIINSAAMIYFSPTGTTKKVINFIVAGMGIDNNRLIDITSPKIRNLNSYIISEDIILIGVPVYATHIPKIVEPFLRSLKGNNKPVVLITLYGNMDNGVALNELYSIAKDSEFKVVAVGSFIGEHSFSTE
ncbi:flavodoxin [Clostridium ragsdalei P11]|uniref:Flavodoxin n=1 Tax=Clostridium ragsdalei P11 TaxID=1353534 RepID=A0A1A6B2F4_9CLOT|nr:flavodoxin domain-containing protein [Clostridium ragsdalei]OBR96526.1 flavodoxin [Clostridium ragsdalei P11]